MADSNPTGNMAVPLRVPERHRGFLSDTISICQDVLSESLAKPERLANPALKRREADAYDRLAEAIDTGSIVPDPEVRRVVAGLLDATDDANEYARVVAEHAALVGLLDQLGEEGS